MELLIVIVLWSLGAVVALGVPAFILLRGRLAWDRLPHTRALVKGPGPSPASQDLALIAFEEAWKEAGFPHHGKLLASLSKLHIDWRFGDYFTEPSIKDAKGEPLKMRGRTARRDYVIVAIWKGAALGDTAFFHELTHAALWVTNNEPDADHEGQRYQGWTDAHTAMISELKKMHRLRDGVSVAGAGVKSQGLSTDVSDVVYCSSCVRDDEE